MVAPPSAVCQSRVFTEVNFIIALSEMRGEEDTERWHADLVYKAYKVSAYPYVVTGGAVEREPGIQTCGHGIVGIARQIKNAAVYQQSCSGRQL